MVILGTAVFFTLLPIVGDLPSFPGHSLMDILAYLHHQAVHLIVLACEGCVLLLTNLRIIAPGKHLARAGAENAQKRHFIIALGRSMQRRSGFVG